MQLEVVGLVKEHQYHIARCTAEVLKNSFIDEFKDPIFTPLLECAWHDYLSEKKKEFKGEIWAFSSNVMCFVDGHFLGDEGDLLEWANTTWGYSDCRPLALYKAMAEDSYSKYLESTNHVFVYLDIAIQEKPVGRLVFELFTDLCPKTCENFKTLCTGTAGTSQSGLKLHYKDSLFHRLVKNGWIQGGGKIYYLEKEMMVNRFMEKHLKTKTMQFPHNNRGVLGMANKGRHSNGSQFYITLKATPFMDRHYVAFGKLIEGGETLKKMEDIPTYNERPKLDCKITDSGIYTP